MSEGSEDPASIGPFVVHRKLGEGAMGVVYAGYDVGLDRKVALKLVRKQLLNKPAVRARMIREAQAMARLSSPFVVQVYQVGEHRDGIYVAMEYIDGLALGEWLKAERRPWQLVLRTLCDAGRGLAAAHSAGLVHRDFKPDNVLVDSTGRARVLDFGLVQSETTTTVGETEELMQSSPSLDETMHSSGVVPEGVDRSNLHWSVRLTQFGRAVGTPAYMSPEQHFGDPVGPFSDQFSFAITLYEALYGVRPFNGDSWDSLKAQVKQGDVPPPPSDSRVPGRIFKILVRGLAIEPDQRWSSMAAMVDALERDPQRARLRVAAVVGLIGVASAGSYAAALSRTTEADRCGGVAQELKDIWDGERKVEVERAFRATGASYADDVIRRVDVRLGAYTEAWVGERRSACEANIAGRQTDHLLDIRVACLERHRSQLGALVEIFRGADRSVVENAVQAVAALPSVSACADSEALLAVLPPSDPQMVLKVEQLRLQLAQVDALEHTGRFEQGLAQAVKVRGEAEALGYAPLIAEAALSEGNLLMAGGRPAEAEEALIRAVKLAIVHDLRSVAGEAAAKRIFVLSQGMKHSAEALALHPVAEALVERVHDDGRLVALLHNNLGVANSLAGNYAKAQGEFEQTVRLLQSRPGAPDPLVAVTFHNLGELGVTQKRPDAARAHFEQACEQFNKIFGETHPFVAHPIAGLGDLDAGSGAYDAAIRNYTRALGLMETAYGFDHPYLMQPLVGLGLAHSRLGQALEARTNYERVVALADRLGIVDAQLGRALEGLGELAAQSDPTRARGLFERAVEVHTAASGEDDAPRAAAMLRAGELAAQLNDPAAAVRWFERVLDLPANADVTVRPAAAVRLAKQLADRPEATARVCDLLAEAQLSLVEADPLRGEAEALQTSRCSGPAK
jgi:tetratricopeptide (TPR) repeat protein/tRNA A-37 threonylcarbamoyl transferase component Bud32